MPLTLEAYGCLQSFAVLFSGGLDSTAVPLVIGPHTSGDIHLLTYKHIYGALVNDWSKRHIPELRAILGDRVEHHLVDHTRIWNQIGALRMVPDMARYHSNFVVCLGRHAAMMTHIITYCLEKNVSNVFICSSVGGEYAVMSMATTRIKKGRFYEKFGIRYNAPLLDLGMRKDEERALLRSHNIDPGWGRRRSHNGFQPICLLGFQHALDIVIDFHTTYNPAQVSRWLDDRMPAMERIIRETLLAKGLDPDELVARNKAVYAEEEARIQVVRSRTSGA